MANVIGPDVSFYQDEPETPQGIDFVKMGKTASFVIIRAGQNQWVDSDFKYNWGEAKLAGLPRGSYWFYDSRTDPKQQAELWVEQFGGDFGELPLFADFEENYNGPYQGWRKWYDFLEHLKTLVGEKEIAIYTGFYYWRDNAPNATTDAGSLEYFHQYPLWVANYGATKPAIPKPWGADEWLFWQYTETGDGALYGVESKGIDLNYFNGDLTALQARFKLSPEPPPPPLPPPPPPPTTGTKYIVTAVSLRIREGPGTTYDVIGYLRKGDIVDEISTTTDKSWIRIKKKDGSVGWASGEYLKNVDTPTPPPLPPPSPTTGETWYRVTAASLHVRDEPGASEKVIGYLSKDDTIASTSTSSDGKWVQVKRLDGLTGWCFKNSLSSLGNERPQTLRQKLFASTTYFRKEITSPRLNVVHVLGIDLSVGVPEFLVTLPSQPNGILCTRTTSQFLEKYGLHLAINGDGFSYITPSANDPVYCPDGGDPVKPNGFAASRGTIYSQNQGATVYINQVNEVTFDKAKGRVFNAVSGDRAILINGEVVKNLAANPLSPRTAIGLTKNGRVLLLMVVDGRQPGYSEGVDFRELANLMVSFGAYYATNMDGGGSSAMVIKGLDGKAHVLNSPTENNVPGKERAVANHLGVFFREGQQKTPQKNDDSQKKRRDDREK